MNNKIRKNGFMGLGQGIVIGGLLFCGYVFLSSRPLAAQEELENMEEIKLFVGEPKTLPVANPTRIAVAKPEIADVQSVSNSEVIIQPKAAGVTTLLIWDTYGEHPYRLRVVSEDFTLLKQHAQSLIKELNLPKVEVKINEDEGKLLLVGEVNDLSEKERLLSSLSSLKDKFLDLVILKEEQTSIRIDTQILEINRENLKNLGLTYKESVTLTDNAPKQLNYFDNMFMTSRWTRGELDVVINMLIKQTKARILSQPKLVCLSGKEADFMVGGEVPIVSTVLTSTGLGGTQVEYKKYGITLKIKPIVKNNANIYLGLSTEVSEIDSSNSVGSRLNPPFAPAFTTRNAQTQLYLKNGQSVIIAGIIKNKDSDTIKKFPFLGDVPILGMLWRSKDFQANQTELVILLTPTIERLGGAAETSSIQRPASVQEPLLSPLNGKINTYTESNNGDLQAYIENVKNMILASLEYPSLANELNSQGTVKVRLRILANGELKDSQVIVSSGSQLLDDAAVKTIKKLAPYPSFPESVATNEIAVDIPIVYR